MSQHKVFFLGPNELLSALQRKLLDFASESCTHSPSNCFSAGTVFPGKRDSKLWRAKKEKKEIIHEFAKTSRHFSMIFQKSILNPT